MTELMLQSHKNIFQRLQKKFSSFDSFTKGAIIAGFLVLLSIPVVTDLNSPANLSEHAASNVPTATWQNVSPPLDYTDPTVNGGNTNYGAAGGIAINPQNTNIVYVGTTYQGIWKTTDGGQSWVKIDTGTGSTVLDGGRDWTLAIDPVNPNVLYTTPGYGAGGLWKSTDGGVNWTDVFSNTTTAHEVGTNGISWVTIDPSNHLHLLASSNQWWNTSANTGPQINNSGLLESLDGGSTWRAIWPAGNWSYSETPFFVTSTTWLMSTQTQGIWRTTDSGNTWTMVSTATGAHEMRNCFLNDGHGRIYVVLTTNALVSSDGGVTWTDISTGLSGGGFYGSLAYDGQYLYTQAWGGSAVFSMPDGGTSWSEQTPTLCITNDSSLGQCQGLYLGDSQPGLVYFNEWNNGVRKLVTGPVATPTPCPGVCPTSTPGPTTGLTNTPSPLPTSGPMNISSLTLYNEQTNTVVSQLSNNQTIDGSTLPLTCMNILATTNPATVGSVVFGFDSNANYHVESIAPYYIGGDNNVQGNCWPLSVGQHTLTVTPFSGSGGTGSAGAPTTVTFTIITSNSPTPPPYSQSSYLVTPTILPSIQPTPIPGDANGDEHVDLADLSLLAAQWNKTGTLSADFNHDGKVDLTDFSLLAGHWGL